MPSVISVALSVVAVIVAGVGFLVAVGTQRSVRGTGERRPQAAGKPPRARGAAGGGPKDPVPVDPRALRDMAIVRYDALQEMSGQLSFSLALLNSQGDGIVLSSINGRAETRTYAKAVVAGKGAQQLSPEEEEAIRARAAGAGAGRDRPESTPKPKITDQTVQAQRARSRRPADRPRYGMMRYALCLPGTRRNVHRGSGR